MFHVVVGIGHQDPLFQQLIARKDILRHSSTLLKLMQEDSPGWSPSTILAEIDYTTQDFFPMVKLHVLTPESTKKHDIQLSMIQRTDQPRLYVQSVIPIANTIRRTVFPVLGNWDIEVDPQYNTSRGALWGQPFERSVLQRTNGTLLKAQEDEVDEILLQCRILTRDHPQWSIWKRLKCAVSEVERAAADHGRDIYEGWVSIL